MIKACLLPVSANPISPVQRTLHSIPGACSTKTANLAGRDSVAKEWFGMKYVQCSKNGDCSLIWQLDYNS